MSSCLYEVLRTRLTSATAPLVSCISPVALLLEFFNAGSKVLSFQMRQTNNRSLMPPALLLFFTRSLTSSTVNIAMSLRCTLESVLHPCGDPRVAGEIADCDRTYDPQASDP